jgi:hypothetical protein
VILEALDLLRMSPIFKGSLENLSEILRFFCYLWPNLCLSLKLKCPT